LCRCWQQLDRQYGSVLTVFAYNLPCMHCVAAPTI
jgi:hypothetical protein